MGKSPAPDDVITFQNTIIKRIMDAPFAARKNLINRTLQGLEAVTAQNIADHMTNTLEIIETARLKLKEDADHKTDKLFQTETELLERQLKERLHGFAYGDGLLAAFYNLRKAEWAETQKHVTQAVEVHWASIRDQIRDAYHSASCDLHDLKKQFAAKMIRAFDEPVPEAFMSAGFKEWDVAVDALWEQLLVKLLKVADTFSQRIELARPNRRPETPLS